MTQKEVKPVLIESIWTGACDSLTGRSTLTFAVGRHPSDQSLGLRLVANSGGGMFCDEWIEGRRIDLIVKGKTELTSRSFAQLHPGRSINTGGFVLACLKHLGLLRVNPENSRFYEHVPAATFQQSVQSVMKPSEADMSRIKGTIRLNRKEI